MSLKAQDRLGPYEILAPLGAGGMGEVYRAHDTRLNRDVAIKILPDDFARDPGRRQRFEFEAKSLAALNHPNLLSIYDVGENWFVAELVTGLPLHEAVLTTKEKLGAAAQIADGLAAAHSAGITHRDLKPSNVMITPEGRVKILDFGLAKQTAPISPAGDTRTIRNISSPGGVAGTASYMSPEQVRGQAIDPRSDIFSFGILLYELLCGERPFSGGFSAEVMSAILRDDPRPLPAEVPPAVARIVTQCLAKEPKQRWQSAQDLATNLLWAADLPSSASGRVEPVAAPKPSRERWFWVAAVLAAVVLGACLTWTYARKSATVATPYRLQISAPKGLVSQPALSPDGQTLVFIGADSRLWLRPLRESESKPLARTENAGSPFWSPDQKWIAFFAAGRLRKIPAAGGVITDLCEATSSGGGTWSARDGGIIVFDGSRNGPLLRVAASGGVAAPVTKVDTAHEERSHGYPQFLSDGRRFVFIARMTARRKWLLKRGDIDSVGEGTPLFPPAAFKQRRFGYTPSGETILLGGNLNSLAFWRFDEKKGVLGSPDPGLSLAEQVRSTGWGSSDMTVAGDTLVFSPRGSILSQLQWRGRTGELRKSLGKQQIIFTVNASPEFDRIAISGNEDDNPISLLSGTTGNDFGLRFPQGSSYLPVWSPDSSELIYMRTETELVRVPAPSLSPVQTLIEGTDSVFANDWSRDGKLLIYERSSSETGRDLWIRTLAEPSGKGTPYLNTNANEHEGQFSPDGRWVAYASDESGRNEVYVESLPRGKGRWKISTLGGGQPRWRRDGRELFFYDRIEQKLMGVMLATGDSLNPAPPVALFPISLSSNIGWSYQPAADGQSFLVAELQRDAYSDTFEVILNWSALLKQP